MVDITGLDYAIVLAFFQSRYYEEPSLLEKMASSAGEAGDPFESIAKIKAELLKIVNALPEGLKPIALDSELLKFVKRSD